MPMNDKINLNDDEMIQQNEERGPGWFLKIAYAVIVAFCVYYLFTYWNWQSSYDEQQAQIQKQIAAPNGN
jgi:hypothetical protein